MPQSDPPSLRAIQLFKDVDEATIGELDRQCRWRRYGAGEQIVDHLDESRDVYFVASGVAEVVVYSSSGRYISFDDLTAGSSFGAIAAIDDMPRSASVVASTEALIGSMPPEAFAKVLMSHPTVAMNLIREMTRIIRMDNDRIVEMSTQGATYRVQAELLRLGKLNLINETTAMLSPPPSQTEIASRVSTTRETVARVLGDLTRRGLLRKAPRTLYINDVPRLEELVAESREASA
jgi:CRP-like cAMP-binding protein